jgi:hypothetical protein
MTEQKLIEILTLENAIEANRMRAALEAREIPFLIKEYADLEYGNVKRRKGWGRLESYKEFEQEILELYKEGFATNAITDEMLNENDDEDAEKGNERSGINPPKKKRTKEIIIILLVLSTSFLAYKVYDLNQIFQRPTRDANFKHLYGRDFYLLQWKRSGKDFYLAENLHGKEAFDKRSTYDLDGRLAYVSFDEDEDGIFEKSIGLDTNNDTLSMIFDMNADGVADKSLTRFNKNHELIFQDFNFDRKCDSVFIDRKSYSVEQFINMLK